MKKGILINPENGTITEVGIENGLNAIYEKIDCDCFDLQRLGYKGKQENDIYVDDNGLSGDVKFGFQFGENQPIAGKGLILGNNPNTGDSVNTNLTLEEVKSKTKLFKSNLEFMFACRAWSIKYENFQP